MIKDYSNTPGIFGIIQRNYKKYPNKMVVTIGKEHITYHELIDKGDRVAAALYDMGVRKGDRVGILIPNKINWYIFLYGILRLGAIVVPFDPQMAEHEIKHLFDKVGIRAVLVPTEFRGINHKKIIDGLRNLLPDLKKVIVDGEVEIDDFHSSFESLLASDKSSLEDMQLTMEKEDSNVFFCTTGSTGTPKIVDIPCRIIDDNISKNSERWGFKEGDRFLLSMPLYHAAGFGWGLSCLSAGGSIYYENYFSPSTFLELTQKEDISSLLITPTLAKIILTHPQFDEYDLSSLKSIIFTGEYLADELADKFVNEMNIRVINALGMTETFVYLDWDSTRDKGISPNKLGEIPEIEIKIVDSNGEECKIGEKGNIHIKNSVMKGYFRLKEVTDEVLDEEGWLNSGDLAVRTEDGRVEFVGREKRIIKRGGNLVAPEEIEQFLRTHSLCAGVIVDKEEDLIMGEKIIAYFQMAEGADISKEELRKFCKGRISAYKIPDEFYFLEEIPKTVGKANPTLLRKLREENKI